MRTCNMEGCDLLVAARGLCKMHYSWLRCATPGRREAAEAVADPPTQGKAASSPKKPPVPTGSSTLANARIAAATELADAMKIKYFAHDGGLFFHVADRAVYLTPGGKFVPAKLVVGGAAGVC